MYTSFQIIHHTHIAYHSSKSLLRAIRFSNFKPVKPAVLRALPRRTRWQSPRSQAQTAVQQVLYRPPGQKCQTPYSRGETSGKYPNFGLVTVFWHKA